MINFKINDKKYRLWNLWHDLTIRDWEILSDVEITDDRIEELSRATQITEPLREDIVNLLLPFTDMPKQILMGIDLEQLDIFWETSRKIILALWKWELIDYHPQPKQFYTFKGVRYHLPRGEEVAGRWVPGWKWDTKSFVEASETIKAVRSEASGIRFLPLLCAIYLREEDEDQWDEDRVMKRQKLFSDLPLTVAFNTFFFIRTYMNTWLLSSRASLKNPGVLERALGWIGSGLLQMQVLWAALKTWVDTGFSRLLSGLTGKENETERRDKKPRQ